MDSSLQRHTVLIVDDTPENILTLANVLRDQYRVVVATSGDEALELVAVQNVDLILLDVMMPEMDGYEVCRRLKAQPATRDIPVIFVTALADALHEANGLAMGAADYVHKPCHAALVRLRVQMHLERHHQHTVLEQRVRERTAELSDTRLEIVRRLGRAAEYRDNETGTHVIRMSYFSRMLAAAAGMGEDQAEVLFQAAPMHDVGKIGVPDRVLTKPGPLDPDEWALMKTHARIGAEIIGDHPSDLMRMARSVALYHHERWDGSGYPHGLAGVEIPLEGRIVAVADVFDALTSERVYKRAWPQEQALEYLHAQAGTAFDPHLVALFLQQVELIDDIRRRFPDPDPTAPAATF